MLSFDPIRSPFEPREYSDDYAYLIFKVQQLRSTHSGTCSKRHKLWLETLKRSSDSQIEDDQVSGVLQQDAKTKYSSCEDSESVSSVIPTFFFPEIMEREMLSEVDEVSSLNGEGIRQYIEANSLKSKKRYESPMNLYSRDRLAYPFWSVSAEAIRRVLGHEESEALFSELFATSKCRSGETLLRHQMFFQFYKLKLRILERVSDAKLANVLECFDVKPLRDCFELMSKLELRSMGKSNKHDVFGFLENELFPIVLREIPFCYLQRISLEAFDFALSEEDHSKYWNSDLNIGFETARGKHPIHVWSDSLLKGQSLRHNPVNAPENELSSSLCNVYEAPWVMPSTSNGAKRRIDSRQTIAATARMFRFEGRRQSYRPKPVDPSPATALCALADEEAEDGFFIRTNQNDMFRADWEPEQINFSPNVRDHRKDFDDILNELRSPAKPMPEILPTKRRLKGITTYSG